LVSTKQLIFPFRIKCLPPLPGLADSWIARTIQEFPKNGELIDLAGVAPIPLGKQVGDEPRQALVLLGRFDAGASGKLVGQGNGHVAHDTNLVFPCSRVKTRS
jgi:hypothetical protein